MATWWGNRSRWQKFGMTIAGGVVALGVVGGALGDAGAEDNAATAVAAPATSASSTTTTAAPTTTTTVAPTTTTTVAPITTATVAPITTTTVAPTTTATVAPITTTTVAPTTTTAAGVGCDPSYPDFCIPPKPPDLNCPDIGRKNFTVLAPDPHGFDRDSDGVGCES